MFSCVPSNATARRQGSQPAGSAPKGASDQLCFISGFQPNPLSRRRFEGMRRPVENRQRGERVRLKAPKGGPVASACCVAALAKGYGHCRRAASCRQMRQTPQRRNIIGQRLPRSLHSRKSPAVFFFRSAPAFTGGLGTLPPRSRLCSDTRDIEVFFDTPYSQSQGNSATK